MRGAEDGLATPEDLTRFVTEQDFTGALEATAFNAAAVAALRDRFEVALGEKVEPVVDAINLTFSETRTLPAWYATTSGIGT